MVFNAFVIFVLEICFFNLYRAFVNNVDEAIQISCYLQNLCELNSIFMVTKKSFGQHLVYYEYETGEVYNILLSKIPWIHVVISLYATLFEP